MRPPYCFPRSPSGLSAITAGVPGFVLGVGVVLIQGFVFAFSVGTPKIARIGVRAIILLLFNDLEYISEL